MANYYQYVQAYAACKSCFVSLIYTIIYLLFHSIHYVFLSDKVSSFLKHAPWQHTELSGSLTGPLILSLKSKYKLSMRFVLTTKYTFPCFVPLRSRYMKKLVLWTSTTAIESQENLHTNGTQSRIFKLIKISSELFKVWFIYLVLNMFEKSEHYGMYKSIMNRLWTEG